MMRFSPKAGIKEKTVRHINFTGISNTHRGPLDHHPQRHITNELGFLVKYDEHKKNIHEGKAYGWTCQNWP